MASNILQSNSYQFFSRLRESLNLENKQKSRLQSGFDGLLEQQQPPLRLDDRAPGRRRVVVQVVASCLEDLFVVVDGRRPSSPTSNRCDLRRGHDRARGDAAPGVLRDRS